MRVLGLTGGIATGKSTASRYIAKRGIPVIDADQVARDICAPNSPTLNTLVNNFGDILLPSGELNRAALRHIVFSDPSARKRLESITHPAIFSELKRLIFLEKTRGKAAAVVDAALMVETGSYTQYDALIVISCDPNTQKDRLIARDMLTQDQAQAIIEAQLPLSEKEAKADFLIMNDGTPDDLFEAINSAWPALFPAS